MTEMKTGKARTFKVVRYVAIAAVLCLALAGAAFASGTLKFTDNGSVILGRFALGHVLEEGEPAANPDNIVEEEGVTYVMPSMVDGLQLAVEDGRAIMYIQYGDVEERLDMTDDLRETGTFEYSSADKFGRCNATVYAVPDERWACEEEWGLEPLVFEGMGYRADADFYLYGNGGRHTGLKGVTGASSNDYATSDPGDMMLGSSLRGPVYDDD